MKLVVTHPPKLPYKRHNPNESGLKRYELKGGRYLIRNNEPRRNRKCKNLDWEYLRQGKDVIDIDDERHHHRHVDCEDHRIVSEMCDEESVPSTLDATNSESCIAASETDAGVANTATVVATTTAVAGLVTDTGSMSPTGKTYTQLVPTSSSPLLSSSASHFYHHHHYHHPHHPLSLNQYEENDGQSFFLQTDQSMFYLSSLEDGFLTEEITEQI